MKGDFAGQVRRFCLGGAAVGAGVLLAGSAGRAYADPPVTMAPPVGYDQPSADNDYENASDTAPDSVFTWTEIPQNERVTIVRATFDQSGYQLYDDAGETITVPFADNNLYVMKFAQSPDGSMFFVNTGSAPVLYIPDGGYLENADVTGARWYPFSPGYDPSTPVYLGMAPSWDDWCDMGWYPGMDCWGGYWCDDPFWGGPCFPTFGFFIEFGGHRFHRFDDFGRFCDTHPGFHRFDFSRPGFDDQHGRFGRGGFDNPSFRGGDRGFASRPAFRGGTTGRTFNHGNTASGRTRTFAGGHAATGGDRTFTHVFHGGGQPFDSGAARAWTAPSGGTRSFDSGGWRMGGSTGPTRSFDSGGWRGGGGTAAAPSFGGGGRSFSAPRSDSSGGGGGAPRSDSSGGGGGGGRSFGGGGGGDRRR